MADVVRLVDLIYAAAQDDRAWEPFLLTLADALGGQCAALISHDLKRTGGVVATARVDPLLSDAYGQHFCKLDPYARALRARPMHRRGGAYTGDMLIGSPDLRTEYVNDFEYRFAISRMITAIIPTVVDPATDSLMGLTILRRQRDNPFGQEELSLMQVLFPHIVRALEVRQRLHEARQAEEALGDVFDLLPTTAIVVDRRMRVRRTNRRAERLLAQADGLSVRSGRLMTERNDDLSRLQAACAAAVTNDRDTSRHGTTLTVWRNTLGSPLRVIVTPLSGTTDPWSQDRCDACALVLVDEPDPGPPPNIQLLRRLYGLTPAEAEIAVRIVVGDGLDEIAEARGSSLQTVQWHSKRILSKMGCRSRRDLVRQLTLSAVSLVGER